MRDELSAIVDEMTRYIVQGRTLRELRNDAGNNWSARVHTLVVLASGWMFLGRYDDSIEILDEARKFLFAADEKDKQYGLLPLDYFRLTSSYISALRLAPPEMAFGRLEELFQKLRGLRDGSTMSTCFACAAGQAPRVRWQ